MKRNKSIAFYSDSMKVNLQLFQILAVASVFRFAVGSNWLPKDRFKTTVFPTPVPPIHIISLEDSSSMLFLLLLLFVCVFVCLFYLFLPIFFFFIHNYPSLCVSTSLSLRKLQKYCSSELMMACCLTKKQTYF